MWYSGRPAFVKHHEVEDLLPDRSDEADPIRRNVLEGLDFLDFQKELAWEATRALLRKKKRRAKLRAFVQRIRNFFVSRWLKLKKAVSEWRRRTSVRLYFTTTRLHRTYRIRWHLWRSIFRS